MYHQIYQCLGVSPSYFVHPITLGKNMWLPYRQNPSKCCCSLWKDLQWNQWGFSALCASQKRVPGTSRSCLDSSKMVCHCWISVFYIFHTSRCWISHLKDEPQDVNNRKFSVSTQDRANFLILLGLTWGIQEKLKVCGNFWLRMTYQCQNSPHHKGNNVQSPWDWKSISILLVSHTQEPSLLLPLWKTYNKISHD